jgi:hypothetical protein
LAFLLFVRVGAQLPDSASASRTQPETQTEAGTQANKADPNQADPQSLLPHLQDMRYWLSGQANFIFQAHPEFHAPYSGGNSLDSRYEKQHPDC